MKSYKDLILDIQNWLNNFSAENRDSMTHKCWEELGHTGQSIDHDLKEIEKEEEDIDSLPYSKIPKVKE